MQKQDQKQSQKQEQKQDLTQIVDEGYRLDAEIKAKNKALEAKKKKIKETNFSLEQKEIVGEVGRVVFSDDTKSSIDPKDLYALCEQLGQKDLFFELVSVKITVAKQRLGEMFIDKIIETEYKPLSKMSFKKKE